MADNPSLERALEDWTKVLGADSVSADEAGIADASQNVAGLERSVQAVLRPKSVEDVQAIVEIANTHSVPIYPVSTGKNFGLGSMLPPRDGAAVVDLSALNRIREVNAQHGYAIIEPGVTQAQLDAYLKEHEPGLFFDVTGAPTFTSIVGNMLDRGVGYLACRVESLLGLELVLGNGQSVRTGFWHCEGAKTAHLLKYGVGPYVDGLFTQSNFGVVTAAVFALQPRPEVFSALWVRLRSEERFPELIDALAQLRKRGVIRTVVHVADRNRTESTMVPLLQAQSGSSEGPPPGAISSWSVVTGLYGTRGAVKLAKREIKKALRGIGKVVFITERLINAATRILETLSFIPWFKRQLHLVRAVAPLTGLARGIPTDAALSSVYWPLEQKPKGLPDPNDSDAGLLYCLPAIPQTGAEAQECVAVARRVCKEHDLECYITLNTMNDHTLEGVINVAFDRTKPEDVERAHRCIDKMLSGFDEIGVPPYRVGIQHMDRVVDENDPFWKMVRDMKTALDPNHIIAPGRYNLV